MSVIIGLVGAGAMGSALGANWRAGGAQVRTCVAGRSTRTAELVGAAGIDTVPTLLDVVAADLVVSTVPPDLAVPVAADIATAAEGAGTHPLVLDLNAVAPSTLADVAAALGDLALVDGSISGGPPRPDRRPRVYLSGPDVARVTMIPAPWLDLIDLGTGLATASALKMCTASLYKGRTALIMHAMLTAQQHGVLDDLLADAARVWPQDVPHWPADIAVAATKAWRYVSEMEEIARTQSAAGLTPQLFAGVADAYRRAAQTPLGHRQPESVDPAGTADAVLADLQPVRPGAVLFDFSGTLFHVEPPEQAVLAALGPDALPLVPDLARWGAINGSDTPPGLPPELEALWERRDLDPATHRAAYGGSAQLAGLTAVQAADLYDRGVAPDAWHPYPETVGLLRDLHAAGVPVAVISNIGWNPREVLARYGVDRDIDVLVLSDEVGVIKPDPAIFRIACARLGVDPAEALMIGDNPYADGGATALGIRFVEVAADPARRAPDALRRATGRLPVDG